MLTLDRPDAVETPHALSVADAPGVWMVAQVLSRNEAAIAEQLRGEGYFAFAPCLRVHRRYARGDGRTARKVFSRPLFPQYVFAAARAADGPDSTEYADDLFYALRSAPHVFAVITVKNQPRFRKELADLETAVRANPDADAYPDLVRGRTCVVRAGPFQSFRGVIDGRTGKGYVVLQMSVMGRDVPTEIDPELLEPL